MLPKSNITPASPVKVLINIGAGLDVPTGTYVRGHKGESVLLGGLGALTGITGKGNTYKSTIMHYMVLSAASRMVETAATHINTYDTEINISEDRLLKLADQFPQFRGKEITNDGTWIVTDKTVYLGDQWYERLKEYLKEKMKKPTLVLTPFMDRNKEPLKIVLPTFTEVDSFTTFETSDVAKIQDENALGDSGANTIHMRQGLSKMRFLMEIPTLGGTSNNYTFVSAHLGKETAIAAGPYAAPPEKKLQHMKQGDKIKGVTDQFFFLTNNFWQTVSCSLAVTKDKTPEFPRDQNDGADGSGNVDLNYVTLKLLRGKFGPSGTTITIAVSQAEGVLPSLTEFLLIKDNERFGLQGNLQHYSLVLYPEVNLSRTTIRRKLDSDALLRRAMNITAELCQIKQYHRQYHPATLEPAAVMEGLQKHGYDMKFILERTRGWWTVNDQDHPLLFLSTIDIVNMSQGLYHPYWMEEDKKTVKRAYLKAE